MTKKDIAINTSAGQIVESKMITAEVTGEWINGTKCWTDEEGNQYTYHVQKCEGKRITYFLLEAVNDQETTWRIR